MALQKLVGLHLPPALISVVNTEGGSLGIAVHQNPEGMHFVHLNQVYPMVGWLLHRTIAKPALELFHYASYQNLFSPGQLYAASGGCTFPERDKEPGCDHSVPTERERNHQ